MYISILDYDAAEVSVVSIDKKTFEKKWKSDAERFISAPEFEGGLGYNLDNVSWMISKDVSVKFETK